MILRPQRRADWYAISMALSFGTVPLGFWGLGFGVWGKSTDPFHVKRFMGRWMLLAEWLMVGENEWAGAY
jgi:hypothetical protein